MIVKLKTFLYKFWSHLALQRRGLNMGPYMTEQLKRFGEYVLDLGQRPANIHITRDKLLFKAQDVARVLGCFRNEKSYFGTYPDRPRYLSIRNITHIHWSISKRNTNSCITTLRRKKPATEC